MTTITHTNNDRQSRSAAPRLSVSRALTAPRQPLHVLCKNYSYTVSDRTEANAASSAAKTGSESMMRCESPLMRT